MAPAARSRAPSDVEIELRDPVTAIVGWADLLSEGWLRLEEDRRREWVSKISEQSSKLARTVHNLIIASRIEAGLPARRVIFDVSELVLGRLADLGRRSRLVKVDVPLGIQVRGDPEHLWEILRNYLENALRWAGGDVVLTAAESEGMVALEVSDSGRGVAENLVPGLFTKDRTTTGMRSPSESRGLGLWVARRLADLNGGEVWFTHASPTGATFGVRFPIAP